MKNLLYIAAIAATAVGFTSCSSNEDLNDAVKDSGVPFKVTASAPTTRATDLISSNFTNFQLYAFEGSSETPWINNVRFAKDASWTPASGTYTWPTKGATSTFYAVSENNSDGTFSGSMSADAKTITYSIPTDISNQKDLLVATTSGTSNDANVNLQFKHALAAAKLTLSVDPSITVPTDFTGFRLRAEIKSITINNINTSGTYDIATNTWSNIGTKGSYVITPSNPIVIDTKNDTKKEVTIDLNGSIMFIPETISYWNIKPNSATSKDDVKTLPTNGDAYITFQAQAIDYDAAILVEQLDIACGVTNAGTGKKWLYKDANGNFFSDEALSNEVATSEGEIINLSYDLFKQANQDNVFSETPTLEWQTYSDAQPSVGQYFAEHTTAGYGTLYKPLCKATITKNGSNLTTVYTPMTLSATNNHIFNINIAGAIRKIDGDGTFGSPAEAGN